MANELVVRYESDYGEVVLTRDIVRKYITKGNANITDAEADMCIELCKRLKLDPFVTGEVHLIKYKENVPAQLVVGYRTYVRRAEEHPEYIGKEDGIIVTRGNEIVKKEGACLYPTEKLIGGWCLVKRLKHGKETKIYKEVALSEYYQNTPKWQATPTFMISKVAIAQALRDAFPRDYNGIYTPEEVLEAEIVGIDDEESRPNNAPKFDIDLETGEIKNVKLDMPDRLATNAEAKKLFAKSIEVYGKDEGPLKVKALFDIDGVKHSSQMTYNQYSKYLQIFVDESTEQEKAMKIEEVEGEVVE